MPEPRTPRRVKPLRLEDFHYLDSRVITAATPQLILGINLPRAAFNDEYPLRDYTFKKGALKWQKIVHQTAGHSCNQQYWIGTILTPTAAGLEGIKKIDDKWLDTDTGCWSLSLDAALDYRQDLKTHLGADCNASWGALEEGHYPIDLQFIPSLVTEKLPSVLNLDDLITWESGMERACGSVNRWSAAILGRNCD